MVVFPREAVKGSAMESHEIFDVDMMITPVRRSLDAIQTATDYSISAPLAAGLIC